MFFQGRLLLLELALMGVREGDIMHQAVLQNIQ